MLGKLLKKDITATGRFFVPMIIIYAIASVLGKILMELVLSMVHTGSNMYDIILLVTTVFATFFIIYIVACVILIKVFIVYDFYKTMAGDQAYLTHMLPVSANLLVLSKVLAAVVWQALTGLVVAVSVALFFAGHYDTAIPGFYEFVSSMEAIGMSFDIYCLNILINLVISAFITPLMFFAAIAIGHLFGKHRILGAIGSYVGIYIIIQIIGIIFLVMIGFRITRPEQSAFLVNSTFLFDAILNLIMIGAFYWVTQYIFSRKLNLD